MPPGKATGKNRDYQVTARNVLQQLYPDLSPYSGDGIDVPFKLGFMKSSTFDVALGNSENRVVVAECRRWGSSVKQDHILAFARKVELLRKKLRDSEVAGLFFTTHDYQIGAVGQAAYEGIQAVICDQNQPLPDFMITYEKYDADREKRLKHGFVNVTASLTPIGSLSIKVIRSDGTVEDKGEVK